MSIVVTYLAYLLISVGLTVLAGQVLSRSGRIFLTEALGGSESAARGITSLIVVSFYLLSLGVIVLTMRIPSNSVSAVHATQLLATKVGVVLLVLGGLYLAGIIALTRLRRRFKAQGQSVPQAALWHPPADRAAR
ncbi:MAG TPA: hypothetical protein VLM11_00365 [Streptosporangiaceae bacterium]|nr:hypothetical protein [Streptosporangiaceae bacterium]